MSTVADTGMAPVFRALADPSRRLLLDKLFERDGQTLSELAAHLEMSRFGVMKHLKLLEAADLVVTRRSGRAKHHYLNPVPIRRIEERWIGKFARPWASALTGLKDALEEPGEKAPATAGTPAEKERDAMTTTASETSTAPQHVYGIYIRCSPQELWRGITDGEMTKRYFHDTVIESSWEVGAPVRFRYADRDETAVEGEVLECDPPRRLSISWKVLYDPAAAGEPPSRVTWEIEPMGDSCRLSVVHDRFAGETATYHGVAEGWLVLLCSLKSLLETGEPIHVE